MENAAVVVAALGLAMEAAAGPLTWLQVCVLALLTVALRVAAAGIVTVTEYVVVMVGA